MNAKTKSGLEVLEAALLLGLLGDALLRATPWGLNVLLWISVLVAVMTTLILRRKREIWTRETIALHGALLFFAAAFVWRDSLTLQTLDVLIILTILAILSLPPLNIQAHLGDFLHYVLGAVNSVVNTIFAPIFLILGDVEWRSIPRNGWTKHALAVFRGLAIAAPILLIFCALFMAADAVFEGIVKNTFKVEPKILFSHVFLFAFFTWITAGYLRGALFGSIFNNAWTNYSSNEVVTLNSDKPAQSVVHDSGENPAAEHPQTETENVETKKDWTDYLPDFLRLGAIEVGVILVLINLLFLSFVIIQLRYFFGGMDFVQTTEDFKLAEYARRGFFELCWVAGLMLPILLTTHFLLKKNDKLSENLFGILSAVNIGLLFIIMFSAVNRMLLYTGNLGYGMTTMRFYPTAFMLWLALVFVWFGLTVLRGQTKRFAWGALWMGLFVVAGLHVLNPDNFIVRHNVKLLEQGRSFDVNNLKNLSDDAVPALAQSLPAMSEKDRCAVKVEFIWRLQESGTTDFRTFNFSRWQAKNTLLRDEINIVGCPKNTWKNGEMQYYAEGEMPNPRYRGGY